MAEGWRDERGLGDTQAPPLSRFRWSSSFPAGPAQALLHVARSGVPPFPDDAAQGQRGAGQALRGGRKSAAYCDPRIKPCSPNSA